MNDAPAPASKAPAAPLVAVALLLAAIGGGYALYARPATPTPRPVSGDMLLDETVSVGPGGVSRRIRVKVPCTVEFTIEPAAPGAALAVSFGLPQPVETAPADAPAAATALSWKAAKGDAPRREVVLAPSLYVLRVEAQGATPVSARVALRALPPR